MLGLRQTYGLVSFLSEPNPAADCRETPQEASVEVGKSGKRKSGKAETGI
jgi:hypothetical protein